MYFKEIMQKQRTTAQAPQQFLGMVAGLVILKSILIEKL
jgi:hypothetical protein